MNQNGPMSSARMPRSSRPVGAGLLAGVGVYTAGLAGPLVALAHGPVPPAPTWPGVLLAWTFNPLPLAAVVGAALGYWWLARRVAPGTRGIPYPTTATGHGAAGWPR